MSCVCPSGQHFSNDGVCVSCPSGQYWSSLSNQCVNCDTGCAACTSSSDCSSCVNSLGYYENGGGKCKTKCGDGIVAGT